MINYPSTIAELSIDEKRAEAEAIFQDCLNNDIFLHDYLWVLERSQHDFKTASLAAYLFASAMFNENYNFCDNLKPKGTTPGRDKIARLFDQPIYDEHRPIMAPYWAPVIYCGGNMVYGRVFSINHCAFSSHDSIIGFRNAEHGYPIEHYKILKGLKPAGVFDNWVLFKLDCNTTDDMTGMLYIPLEKNFTIEFAHFPHKGGKNIVFRWIDC